VVGGRLQQRTWTAEDGNAHSVDVVTEELGPSLRWVTVPPVRAVRTGSASRSGASGSPARLCASNWVAQEAST
jgi:hypothetical protein